MFKLGIVAHNITKDKEDKIIHLLSKKRNELIQIWSPQLNFNFLVENGLKIEMHSIMFSECEVFIFEKSVKLKSHLWNHEYKLVKNIPKRLI